MGASHEIRKASRARAPDSPSSSEHRDVRTARPDVESAATMKSILFRKYGPPDLFKLGDVAKPVPAAGEVLVRIHASSINSWDAGFLWGEFPNRFILGHTEERSSSAWHEDWRYTRLKWLFGRARRQRQKSSGTS
jgi:hypothetical protein